MFLIFRKHIDVLYSVELDDGDCVTVSRSALFMTEDQAKILRETVALPLPTKSSHRKADISLGKNSFVYCCDSAEVMTCCIAVFLLVSHIIKIQDIFCIL
jgi:hypothetical protein